MIRDLQDDHHDSPDDFLLRCTSKSVTLGCLENEGKDTRERKGRRSGVPVSKRKDKADETPREADEKKNVEELSERKKDGHEAERSGWRKRREKGRTRGE